MKISSLLATILIAFVIVARGSEVISLGTDTFEIKISKGRWFIKFFAPWCPYCNALAPIWTQLAKENGDALKSKGFYIAEVDCTLYGDICERNKVNGYPTLHLFVDGKIVGSYEESRNLESLSSYAKINAEKYYVEVETSPEDIKVEAIPDENQPNNDVFAPPNPMGTVVILTSKNFDELTNSGSWFVKFFAPWCGHCQKLAPIWDELGRKLQNKVNVGKVDCTVDGDLCTRFKVQGYPTLKLLHSADDIIDYKGARQLQNLQDFAEKAAGARVSEITLKEFDKFKKIDDVLFIYIYNETTPFKYLRTIKGLSRSFFSVRFYSSKDSKLSEFLNVEVPALVVVKDELQKNYPASSPDAFSDRKALKSWIRSEKYPLVPAMDQENYEDILGGNRLVVLGILKPNDMRLFIKAKNSLKTVAKLYYQQIKKHDDPEDDRNVIFAWLDGGKWSDYIYGVYGLTPKDLPTVLIADPMSNEYFDMSRTGEKISLYDQKHLLESIHDAKTGYLVGKSTVGFLEKTFRDLFSLGSEAQQTMFNHPLFSLVLLILACSVFWRCCLTSKSKNKRDCERGYDKVE